MPKKTGTLRNVQSTKNSHQKTKSDQTRSDQTRPDQTAPTRPDQTRRQTKVKKTLLKKALALNLDQPPWSVSPGTRAPCFKRCRVQFSSTLRHMVDFTRWHYWYGATVFDPHRGSSTRRIAWVIEFAPLALKPLPLPLAFRSLSLPLP